VRHSRSRSSIARAVWEAAFSYALSAYVALGAIYSPWPHKGQDFTIAGLLVSGLAIPPMYLLAKGKIRIADRIASRALRADSVESLTCGYLSVVVFVALIAQLPVGAWWVSGVSALVLIPFLLREAHEAWEPDACCHE
jgi:divalent metal cation (Fe/Co/Zn/Cd) transporter